MTTSLWLEFWITILSIIMLGLNIVNLSFSINSQEKIRYGIASTLLFINIVFLMTVNYNALAEFLKFVFGK